MCSCRLNSVSEARCFLRNVRRADLVVPAFSAVCHKRRSVNLLALRACSVAVASNSCIVTAVYFPYFHVEILYRAPSQGNAYSPTAQVGLQSFRTDRHAVLPHKQACSPAAQTDPQSHRTNICEQNVLFISHDFCALQ